MISDLWYLASSDNSPNSIRLIFFILSWVKIDENLNKMLREWSVELFLVCTMLRCLAIAFHAA